MEEPMATGIQPIQGLISQIFLHPLTKKGWLEAERGFKWNPPGPLTDECSQTMLPGLTLGDHAYGDAATIHCFL